MSSRHFTTVVRTLLTVLPWLVCVFANVGPAAESRFMEAENLEMQGFRVHWNPEAGYSGHGGMALSYVKIPEGTSRRPEELTLVGRFAQPLPPGDYRVAIRYYDAVPELRLTLGDATVETDPETVLYNSPAPLITRLYPDRLIINVTNACTMFCRHCLRRRHISFENVVYAKKDVEMALSYVREHEEIRDVLITGGDALCLGDDRLDWILTELDKIDHVEIKRLGSRTLAVQPLRVTDALCAMLSRHDPVYLNTQFNHPREITHQARDAVDRLTRAGVLVGNQAVLLKGINADRHVMKKLMQDLLRIKVRPYYIFNCKKLEGIRHFRPSIEDGLNIMEYLRNFTSGLAVPTYICTLPNGRGKTPVMPQYLVNSNADGKARFRSWQGYVVDYDDEKWDPSVGR